MSSNSSFPSNHDRNSTNAVGSTASGEGNQATGNEGSHVATSSADRNSQANLNRPNRNRKGKPNGNNSINDISHQEGIRADEAKPNLGLQSKKVSKARKKHTGNRLLPSDIGTHHQRNRHRNKKKSFWWKNHVPIDAVDPITLDPLTSLTYPPFALVVSEPYDPVPEWPLKESSQEQSLFSAATVQFHENEEERQKRILTEQWGSMIPSQIDKKLEQIDMKQFRQRHVNLFDGRALAYYMVSQLQFIDPLNRRDSTRDELLNLDRYLRRNGFGETLNVTEAYDTKGITLSTAGAVANTAAGRAAILQQEAKNLLLSLFRGTSAATAPRSSVSTRYSHNTTSLMPHNHAIARGQRRSEQPQPSRENVNEQDQDTGIYGDGGLIVIDDDLNPGLRGHQGTFQSFRERQSSETPPSMSESLVGKASAKEEFPMLMAAAPPIATDNHYQHYEKQKKQLPVAATLAKISSAVKKTDPEEIQRQIKARELARKKAMLSNLTFGSNGSDFVVQEDSTSSQFVKIALNSAGPTDAQIERNKAFADALNVKPATVRHLISGWARPTDTKFLLDEFGNELNTTVYPDDLIKKARENLAQILKLEDKWIHFLNNDKAASMPLNRMEKSTRAMVHEYASFWKLHTESFEPEPHRYVHCVKLKDTRAPYPLLSFASKNWNGPKPYSTFSQVAERHSEHSVVQTAGQSTHSREIPQPPERKPLALKARVSLDRSSGSFGVEASNVETAQAFGSAASIGGAPSRSMTDTFPTDSRFGSLTEGRERPKLELKPRTVPYVPPKNAPSFDVKVELAKQQGRARSNLQKMRNKSLEKQRALEAAFASDDEDSDLHENNSSDSSDWEEQEPMFTGSDDE